MEFAACRGDGVSGISSRIYRDINTSAAMDRVFASTAKQYVIAVTAAQPPATRIGTGIYNNIVSRIAVRMPLAGRKYEIIAGAAPEQINSAPVENYVVSRLAKDGILANTPQQNIIPALSVNIIVSPVAGDQVIAGAA